ncbi:luciferase family protein [Nocardioides aquiterrae]|uniref:Luciferase domain-containing protein n=1 Tax=Nocardioides aquiterrae TaxID=203799 RepID=A0ABN1UG47_9ACTN
MFLVGSEFAHLHPTPDLSLHAALPRDLMVEAIEAGWAEPHPIARLGLIPDTIVMLYAPRDENELDVVADLVTATHALLVP